MIRSISAVFIFILPIYPALSTANQLKGLRVANSVAGKAMTHGRASTMPMAVIRALETSINRQILCPPLITESPEHITGEVLKNSGVFKQNDSDRNRRIQRVVYHRGSYFYLEIMLAGPPELLGGQPAKRLDIEVYEDAGRIALEAARYVWSLKNS